jgi:hypothetical protein
MQRRSETAEFEKDIRRVCGEKAVNRKVRNEIAKFATKFFLCVLCATFAAFAVKVFLCVLCEPSAPSAV